MSIGTDGRIEVFEHFLGFNYTGGATMSATHDQGHLMTVASASGAITQTTDEPGGILTITLDTTDDTNCVVYTVCPFKPADGGCWMETRFKSTSTITSVAMWAGFQETVNTTTPVIPAEFATESFAYNSSIGGFAGVVWDPDATTDDWRYVGGVDTAPAWDADSDAARAYQAAVSDKFDVVRVEISPHGDVDIYLATKTGGLRLLKHKSAVVTPTDMIFPTLIIENRAAAVSGVLEVDYFNCGGFIDWTQ